MKQLEHLVKRYFLKLVSRLGRWYAVLDTWLYKLRHDGKVPPPEWHASKMKLDDDFKDHMNFAVDLQALLQYFSIEPLESKVFQTLLDSMRGDIKDVALQEHFERLHDSKPHRPALLNALLEAGDLTTRRLEYIDSVKGGLLKRWIEGEKERVSFADLQETGQDNG